METRTLAHRSEEEQTDKRQRSLHMESKTHKRKFKSSDESLESVEVSNVDMTIARATWTLQTHLETTCEAKVRREMEALVSETRGQKSILFGNDMERIEKEIIHASRLLRVRADKRTFHRKAQEKARQTKEFQELCSRRAPMFWIPLRAHSVWERMTVTLSCTILGSPPPTVKWYKNGVPIELRLAPAGKYRMRNEYGVLTLEISRCSMDDSADYSVEITNICGQATSFANVLVRKYHGLKSGWDSEAFKATLPVYDADFSTALKPVFSREKEPFTLSSFFSSGLLEHQKKVQWFQDGVLLQEHERLHMKCTDHDASLSVPCAYKEDEGFYTLRIPTHDGHNQQSAYVFVRDAAAAVMGAPGAPLSVKCHDVQKDSLLLSWTPPSDDRGSPVFGYYVERLDPDTKKWVLCNEKPVKVCRFPVAGLAQGKTYQFRVQAVNQAGASHPSKASDPVTMKDPLAGDRDIVIPLGEGRSITICKDDLEGDIRIPFPPTNVHAKEISEDYVVLAWDEPDPRGKEPLTYYIEKSIAGSDRWQRANLDTPVDSLRYTALDLLPGKPYCFRVRAVNKYGVSEPSLSSDPISPKSTIALPDPPGNVLAYRDSKTSVDVHWDKAKGDEDLLGYYVYCRQPGQQKWETVNNKPIKDNNFNVPGLQTGKEYEFCVKSVNEAGLSSGSPASTPLNVNEAIYCPSAPYDFALLSCGKDEMVIGWKAPKFRAGKNILGYFLDQHDTSEIEWGSVSDQPIPTRVCKVSNLTQGQFYEFRARAVNLAGVGEMSEPSEAFKCEEWTMPQPGPPYDVRCTEVRNSTLMVHWEPPVYTGASPVTGYHIELCEEGSKEWKTVNEKPTPDTHLRVSDLETDRSYCFRARAVNSAGVGMPSVPSDPVVPVTKPGTNEIEVGVDEEGYIYMLFENPEPIDSPEFIWTKDYQDPPKPNRVKIENDNNKSKMKFTKPSAKDLGTYSVEVPNTDGVSASRTLTKEELDDLLRRSHEIRNPEIELISGWNVEVLEKGEVRLWLQVEELSPEAELHLIFNNKELTSTPEKKINFDRDNGLVEVIMQHMTEKDRGTYTAQLKDGKAANQFSLTLTGDDFDKLLAESEFQRKEWKRKQGPHFLEYLKWTVTEDCHVLIDCKVTNTKKETVFKWFFNTKTQPEGQYDAQTGVGSLLLTKFAPEEKGIYKATVSDNRGEDVSELDLTKDGYDEVLKALCRMSGLSASPLQVQSTAEGIKLYSTVKFFTDAMKPTWYHKDKKLASTDRLKSGSTMNQVWMLILNPTEADKGKYALELFDGKDIHKRTIDLSGQVFDDAMAEYQRLKQAAIAEKNRARVVRGLPDVATIMEDKTLCLTCIISGDPMPEVAWLKNEREISFKDRYKLDVKGTVVTITIEKVCSEDSGKYSIFVKNKYGSETGQVTVSVFKHGEEPEELKKTFQSP
ncbi:myomesin-3 [Ambystoma mexicanum]|uniref:myomesin-3 n=1 Tax=Ambystoma mexicanum TaxID=8296 RepID=UPI0037E9BFB6